MFLFLLQPYADNMTIEERSFGEQADFLYSLRFIGTVEWIVDWHVPQAPAFWVTSMDWTAILSGLAFEWEYRVSLSLEDE